MPLTLPPVEHLILGKSPLEQVVGQIKFAPILAITRPDFIAPFQEAIRHDYPILVRQEGVGFGMAMSPLGSATITPPVPSTHWRFSSAEGDWLAVLAPDALGLETQSYTAFDDFSARFQRLLEALVQLGISHQARLGLRYINSFVHPARPRPADWKGLIKSELLGALAADEFTGVERSAQEIRTRQEDGWFVLRLVSIPGGENEPTRLVLDFDYYVDGQREFDIPQVMQTLRRYNEITYAAFRWAVLPPLLEEYSPKDASN